MNHVASGSSYISFLFLPIISRLLKFSYFFRKIIEIERHFVIGFYNGGWTKARKIEGISQ